MRAMFVMGLAVALGLAFGGVSRAEDEVGPHKGPVAEWGEEPFDNTAHIASICNVDLPVGKKRVYQMPALPIPEGRTMAEELRQSVSRFKIA